MAQVMMLRRGGAASLKVIAVANEAALPTGVREGTLAVAASSAGDVYMQRDQPAGAADGAVWIVPGIASEIPVNLTGRGSLYVYPLRALTYAGGSWTITDLWGYVGGTWVSGRYYLYDYGAFGNGVYSESESQGTVTPEADNLHIVLTGNSGANQALAVFANVDFTGRNTLRVVGDVLNNRYTVYITDSVTVWTTLQTTVVTTDGAKDIDVSALTGRHYVLIGQGAGQIMEARIYEAYLV